MIEIKSEDLKLFSINQNLLMVEDSEDMQLLLDKRLRDLFKNVDIASNGKEAIQMYQKDKYHIILSDIRMPEMDGIELLKEIRKNDLDQKVIFMSGHDDSYYYNELINANANGFVLKPIKMDKLINILYINCKNAFVREEHEKNMKKIDRLYHELSYKNKELTKANLKFRYLYKKLKDKLEKEIDEIISKREINLNPPNTKEFEISMKNEYSEIQTIKPKIQNQKPLLSRNKISAKDFLNDIEFFKFEDEMKEDLDELEDLEEDIKLLIDNLYENKISFEVIDKIVLLFNKYADILSILTSFDTIERAIKSLAYTIKNIDLEKINLESKIFLDYIYMMVADLKNWKENLFIKQNLVDIHYLDDSLLNNSLHIENYILSEKEKEEENNLFFF